MSVLKYNPIKSGQEYFRTGKAVPENKVNDVITSPVWRLNTNLLETTEQVKAFGF